MAARVEGAWLAMITDKYIDETEQERRERLQSGRCCWHCRYYIRPIEVSTLDGPLHSICTIDRVHNMDNVYGELAPGEKYSEPDD
jgi:hypothetical protein